MIKIPTKDNELIMSDGQTFTTDAAGTVSSSAKVHDFGADWKRKGLVTLYVIVGDIASNPYVGYNLQLQFAATSNGFASLQGIASNALDVANHVEGNIYAITTDVKHRYARFYVDVVGGTGDMYAEAFLSEQYDR